MLRFRTKRLYGQQNSRTRGPDPTNKKAKKEPKPPQNSLL